ncbi:hypothetical protein LINGRAHAP2_LOCUS27010 [Linum grandiflorum]
MGTCHGFICLARVQPPHDLVVLNPSTGERHVVTSFLNGEEFNEVKSYGFGCVLYEKEGKSDIWMMKEYGMIESWTKLYTIQLDSVAGSVIPLGSNAGRILLMFGRGRFVWCDPGRNLVVEAFSGGDETYEAIYCLDSLVKLFQLPEVDDDVEVKRKEHQAKLALRDQDNSSYDDMSSLLSMIHDMDPSIFEEIPTASDEED